MGRAAPGETGVRDTEEDSYPKIHFLDHLLRVALQNHTTR